MNDLQHYRDAIARYGGTTDEIDAVVARIGIARRDEQDALLATLDALPAASPSAFDRDYAALALEAAAASVADRDLARRMLATALNRAAWFASGATSGGEGLARSLHVRALEAACARG